MTAPHEDGLSEQKTTRHGRRLRAAALEVGRRGSRWWRVSAGVNVSEPPRVDSVKPPSGRRRVSRRARAAQGWSFRVGFEYLISAMCGLGSPLTNTSPDSTEGRMLAVLFASWQRAIGGTIIGLTGGIPILKVEMTWHIRIGRANHSK